MTADGCRWIKTPVKRWCPNAEWVMDPFRVVSWMNDALDGVRREEWQVAKRAARAATPKRGRPGRPSAGDETPPGALKPTEAAKAIRDTSGRRLSTGPRWPPRVGRAFGRCGALGLRARPAPKAAMAIELWAEKRAQLENGEIDADGYEDWKASL